MGAQHNAPPKATAPVLLAREASSRSDLRASHAPKTLPEGSAGDAGASTFVTASHAVLFAGASGQRNANANNTASAPGDTCDACGDEIIADDEASDSFAFPGSGLYVWSRGTEVRYEEAPLCASCAAAIGLRALAGWDIEEEEG